VELPLSSHKAFREPLCGEVIITPVLGLGVYNEGASKHLGGTFQFRTELGFTWELDGSRNDGRSR